jgi:outer membrane protein insertion porin family
MIRRSVFVCASFIVISPLAFAQEAPCEESDCQEIIIEPQEEPQEESEPPKDTPKGLPGSFSIGAGFSSQEGFIATSAVQHKNLFGSGYQLSLNAGISSQRQDLFLQLKSPPGFNEGTVALDLGVTQRTFQNGLTQNWNGARLTWSRPLDDNWQLTLRGTIADSEATAPVASFPKDLLGGGPSAMGTVGLAYKAFNDPENPRDEFSYSIKADLSQNLTRDGGFFRIENDIGYAFSLRQGKQLNEGPTLRFGISMGYMSALTEGGQVPVTDRFFVGGENSVRGFAPGSLGPELKVLDGPSEASSSIDIGGLGKAVFRSELSFPLIKKVGIHGLAFFDAGNTFGGVSGKNNGLLSPEEYDFGVLPLRTAAGVGIRWNSPIGQMNFTFGVPLDRRPGEAPVLFQFSIGSGL